MTYTPEQLDLAREIANEHCLWHPATKHWQEAHKIALSAIVRTTELAKKYTASLPCDTPREIVAEALGEFDHLKGPSDGA
jgi:hypothetical protein